MFGYGKRIKELEEDMKKLLQARESTKGYHKWTYGSGYPSGMATHGSWTEYKTCKSCGKFIKLQETEKK